MPRNSDDHDLFAGTLDVMILHLLRLKPMHGYALVRTSRKFQTICCRSNRSLSTPPYRLGTTASSTRKRNVPVSRRH